MIEPKTKDSHLSDQMTGQKIKPPVRCWGLVPMFCLTGDMEVIK